MRRLLCLALLLLGACGASTSPLVEAPVDAGVADAGRVDGGADAGTPPVGLVFRLSFRSDVGAAESLYAQESSSSREGPGWLSVRAADGTSLELTGRCDLCECPTSGTACLSCPRCGPPPDIVRALSGAGGSIEHLWDGLAHPTGTCDLGELALCAAPPVSAPPGDYIATFCWSGTTSGVGIGHVIGISSCDEVPFHLPDADGIIEDAVCFCG